MKFSENPKEFLEKYSFVDKEEIYTNGVELIPVFRVEQLLEHIESRFVKKRVLMKEWLGYRYTRYTCPNCKKFVKNGESFCHKCGQALIFPNISFTPYVEGKKQELIITWEDE